LNLEMHQGDFKKARCRAESSVTFHPTKRLDFVQQSRVFPILNSHTSKTQSFVLAIDHSLSISLNGGTEKPVNSDSTIMLQYHSN
jgi:hypothetical protein